MLLLALPAHGAERVMVGHYATFGDLPVEQIPWSSLTHLCHAFLRVDADGKPIGTDAVPNPALTADGRRAGVPVLMTIGGGATVKGLAVVAADEQRLTEFVSEVTGLVEEGRYDGVHVGWEFPFDEATKRGHQRLIARLRSALGELAAREGRDATYLLTATVSPSPDFGQWVDIERVVGEADWLEVAAYDMSGPWSRVAALHAPLFASSRDPERESRSVAGAMRYWQHERGVPKEKLVVAAPLFGRSMPVARPFDALDPDQGDRHRVLPFSAVRRLVGEGWFAEWDNESRAPWLRKPAPRVSGAGASPLTPVDDEQADDGPELITYEDRNSIHLKATWAREQGYRGMSFWAVHQDRMPDGRHWLINAANKAWPAE
ncbi:glycoside hydrolase family 18 protein [Botrimarina sp.]|uniref:glycoside hydrolase family 18 protein n=1 Tax=Botrimarina sp. TaxID=2795802 RepID=UPI0032EA9CF7